MKKILLFILLIQVYLSGQIVYKDYLLDNTIYTNAPEEIRNRKPFIREWKFFDDRAYPQGFIPEDAYVNALRQRNELRTNRTGRDDDNFWGSSGANYRTFF